jgi:colanic acid/amylovoran biosynthesis glycosyltransferase
LDFLTSTSRKLDAKILHSHFGYVGWANLEVARQAAMMHIVTFYGEDVNRLPNLDPRWRVRYQALFEQADRFLCEGPHMAGCLIELGCPSDKIDVHHLGVAVDEIAFRPREWHRGERFRVLIASSFREKKGIPFALEALAKIQSDVALEITIIGDAISELSSQKEKQRIFEIIENRGLATKTRMLGFQPYSVLLEEAYQHHIFLLPSVTAADGDTEGGAPVVLIEMMATGMPVVSTSHCDIPSVVQYGIKDWLVAERDVDGLTERLQWIIKHSAEWEQMLAVGRKHVQTGFDVRTQGNQLAQIYQNMMESER